MKLGGGEGGGGGGRKERWNKSSFSLKKTNNFRSGLRGLSFSFYRVGAQRHLAERGREVMKKRGKGRGNESMKRKG